ncbi:MAG: hypothetical protein WCS18_11340, partial [Sphaerochaetaceae bacterium]
APSPADLTPGEDGVGRYVDPKVGIEISYDNTNGEVGVFNRNTGRQSFVMGGPVGERMQRAFAIADAMDKESQGRDIVNAKKEEMLANVLKAKGVGGNYVIVKSRKELAGQPLSKKAIADISVFEANTGKTPQAFVDTVEGTDKDGKATFKDTTYFVLDEISLGEGPGAIGETMRNIVDVATHEPVHVSAKYGGEASDTFRRMYDKSDKDLRLEVIKYGIGRERGPAAVADIIKENLPDAKDDADKATVKERALRRYFEEGVAYLKEGTITDQATAAQKLKRKIRDAFKLDIRTLTDLGVLAEEGMRKAKGTVNVGRGETRIVSGQNAEEEAAPVEAPAATEKPAETPPAATVAEDQAIAAMPEPAAEPPPVEEMPPADAASVPVMVTKKMEADLRAKGYSQADIDKMTPQTAWVALNEKPAPERVQEAPESVQEAPAPVQETAKSVQVAEVVGAPVSPAPEAPEAGAATTDSTLAIAKTILVTDLMRSGMSREEAVALVDDAVSAQDEATFTRRMRNLNESGASNQGMGILRGWHDDVANRKPGVPPTAEVGYTAKETVPPTAAPKEDVEPVSVPQEPEKGTEAVEDIEKEADRKATALDKEWYEGLAKEFGAPAKPVRGAAGSLETLSRAGDMLRRAAEKSKNPTQLARILREAQNTFDESRVADDVANNPNTDGATFEKAVSNEKLLSMVGDEYVPAMRKRRAELIAQAEENRRNPPPSPAPKPAKKLTRPQKVAAFKKAIAAGEPVSAATVDDLGLKIPDTYGRQGDMFVKMAGVPAPEASKKKTRPQTVGTSPQVEAKPAVSEVAKTPESTVSSKPRTEEITDATSTAPVGDAMDKPWMVARKAVEPYALSLRGMSEKQLKTEEKKTANDLNNWANKTPALLDDHTLNPKLNTVESHTVSERYSAVLAEIESRKNTPSTEVPASVQKPAETPAKTEKASGGEQGKAKAPELMTPEELATAWADGYGASQLYLLKGLESQNAKAGVAALEKEKAAVRSGKFLSGNIKSWHTTHIRDAFNEKKPVNAAAVDAYKIQLPKGYVREGDLYVFKPEPPPDGGGKKPSPPAREPETQALQTGKPSSEVSGREALPVPPIPQGSKVATAYGKEGVSYRGEFLRDNGDGTSTIRAFGEKPKTGLFRRYGVGKDGVQIVKEITVPSASVSVTEPAADLSKLTPAQRNALRRAAKVQEKTMGEEIAAGGGETMFRVIPVEEGALLSRLENGETIKAFRAMQVIDGKLYPPMSAKVQGKLREPSEIGRWEQAVEQPELVRNGKFVLDKANKTIVPARYNPYFHTSLSPLNDQFSSAYSRPNLVVVEVELPKSELTSGYRAEGAKDSVGMMSWHSGPVSSKLPKEKARKVILTRFVKPVRVVPDSEVAEMVANLLEGEDVVVPENVVTPALKAELVKRGVAISPAAGGETMFRIQQAGEQIQQTEGTENEQRNIAERYGLPSLTLPDSIQREMQGSHREKLAEDLRGVHRQFQKDLVAKGETDSLSRDREEVLLELRKKETEVVERYAVRNGLVLDNGPFYKNLGVYKSLTGDFGAEGMEHLVFVSPEEPGIIVKINKMALHESWLEYLNKLSIHNFLFPETAYKLVGFTKVAPSPSNGEIGWNGISLRPVLSQAFVSGEREAKAVDMRKTMEAKGFSESDEEKGVYTSEKYPGIKVTDLHDGNGIVDSDGTTIIFDPMIKTTGAFGGTNFRVSQQEDADYMVLAEKALGGDKGAEAQAQAMVDRAARAVGYNV